MSRSVRTLLVVFAVLLLGVMPAFAGPPDGSQGKAGSPSAAGLYIVQMSDQPAVAYGGGIPGFKATKPAKGQKIDPNSPDVIKYTGYLNRKHDGALDARRRRPQAVRLHHLVQRFRRPAGWAGRCGAEVEPRRAGRHPERGF